MYAPGLFTSTQHVKHVAGRIAHPHRSIRPVNIASVALLEVRFELVRRMAGRRHPPDQRHRDSSVRRDDHLAAQLRLVPDNYFEFIIAADHIGVDAAFAAACGTTFSRTGVPSNKLHEAIEIEIVTAEQ